MTFASSQRFRRLRFGLWSLVAVTSLILGAAYLIQLTDPREGSGTSSSGDAEIHSKFALTDHNGNRVSEVDFAGRWQLVFFGFTHCPDICPTTLAYMADVLNRLDNKAARVAPIFITVDPSRDTPAVMAEYVRAFHPNFIGLTGTDDEVAAAAQAFRVYYEKMEDASVPDGYLMAHSGHIYLMTPEGDFETVFREGDQTAEAMAAKLLSKLEKEQR